MEAKGLGNYDCMQGFSGSNFPMITGIWDSLARKDF